MTAAVALLVTYFGTACFLLDIGGTRILTDPGDFFTGRLTVEAARELKDVNLILVSHGDFDHVNRLGSVPGSGRIPILAPDAVKAALPGYPVHTEPTFVLGDVRVRAFPSTHGFFHDKDHRGYLLECGGLRLCYLGDAYKVDPAAVAMIAEPDVLFVTIGGLETDIGNALRNVALLRPGAVVPMHWETLWRCGARALEFRRIMADRFPAIPCIIPEYDQPFEPAPRRPRTDRE